MASDVKSQARDEVLKLISQIQQASKLSHWSPAVQAAPEAIQAMAICLRAASNPEAKAIDVGRSWVDLEGERIIFP
jgi:hypothetical protein